MRHVGDEVAAHGLEPAQPRHVVEHDEGADHGRRRPASRQQGAVRLQVAVLGADTIRSASTAAAPERLRHDALEVGVADDLLDGLALGRAGIAVQQPRRGGVDGDDALLRVHGHHALDHAGEHRLALVALVVSVRNLSSSSSAMRLMLSATEANSSILGT